jgi:AsmA-like protein
VAFFTRSRLIRAARYAAYAAFATVALALVAALVVPAFLDTKQVGAELEAKLSQAVHGEVVWEKLEIRLLPSPRGALAKVRVEIPGTASLRAEAADAHLRLLPLLRGRAEIASVSLSKPEIRLEVVPSPKAGKKPGQEAQTSDPIGSYRSAIEAVRRFAPQAVLDVEDGDLDVRVPGLPPARLRKLQVHAETGNKGLEVELTAESEYWSGLKLSAQVAFSDASGTASLKVAEARPQVWLDHFLSSFPVGVALPAASLRAEARTDGKVKLECDFDLGAASVEILRAGERLQLPDVALAGRVAASAQEIAVRLKTARLGAGRLAEGSLRYSLKDKSLAGLAEFDLDLAQAMEGTRRLAAQEAGAALSIFDPVTGRARGQVKVNVKRSGWNVAIEIAQSDSSIGIKGAPGPVRLARASMELGRDAARVDRADLSMLDARSLGSATIALRDRVRIEAAVSEGSVGEEVLAWIWKAAELPPHLALKAPVQVAVQRAAWSPKQPLDLEATARFDAGPSIAVELGWMPGALDVRRAAVKDARSDAVIALREKGSLLEGKFSGSLQSASLAAALKGGKLPSGGASGDLRFTFDRRHPDRISADGKLKGEAIDLEWLVRRPVKIDNIDLQAGGGSLRIREAAVNWAEQRLRLRGEVRRGADGPVIDAQLDSPGVVLDALLRPSAEEADEKAKQPAAEERGTSKLWPLPVTGLVAVRADYVQSGRYKVTPFAAAFTLESQRARVDVQQAQLCGVSLPLTVEATPEGVALEAHIAAHKQGLEETSRCLTERGVQITGNFDLKADLRARGRLRDFARNLEGTVRAESRDGRVMKFALLGNILSLKGVSDMLKEGAPKADSEGFSYRSLSARGRFEAGRFIIDESAFDSSAVGLAATGWISIVDYQSKLSVLVAPFARVDRLARKVPIVGYILGGAFTSIPVGVSGDIRDPLVVPLGPGAVTSELLGIFERTLKLPAELLPQQRGDSQAAPSAP